MEAMSRLEQTERQVNFDWEGKPPPPPVLKFFLKYLYNLKLINAAYFSLPVTWNLLNYEHALHLQKNGVSL